MTSLLNQFGLAIQANPSTGQSRVAYRLAVVILVYSVIGNLLVIADLSFLFRVPFVNMIIPGLFFLFPIGFPQDVKYSNIYPYIWAFINAIDLTLITGLLLLRKGARDWTILRAVSIGIISSIVAPITENYLLGILISLIPQWGFSSSLVLLLTGKTKLWRILTSVLIFVTTVVIFNLGVYFWFLAAFAFG